MSAHDLNPHRAPKPSVSTVHTQEDDPLLQSERNAPLSPASMPPAQVMQLQRRIGNRAVQRLFGHQTMQEERLNPPQISSVPQAALQPAPQPVPSLQLGRTKTLTSKMKKERSRKTWQKGRKWPEQQLKGRLLERLDKYMIRTQNNGYIDMNKLKANFPAIDGIADGVFRQVKAYLPSPSQKNKKLAKKQAVDRIVSQVIELEDKCEIAARQLLANRGQLLGILLDIDEGTTSTKGRTGTAPYTEMDTSAAARQRHMGVLPDEFREFGFEQLALGGLAEAENDVNFDYDVDGLAQVIMNNMVVIVPDDLVEDVQIELIRNKIAIKVEGAGGDSAFIQNLMNAIGYTASTRGKDDDTDYTED